jgi:hypothetical protein
MKKLVLFSFLVLCISQTNFAQEIKAYKTFGGVRFEMDTLTLGLNQVLEIVKENPDAYAELKRAKRNYSAAGVCGFAGAILIIVPIGTALAGGSPEWGLAAGGAALLVASIPLTRSYRGHTMEALDLYNAKYKLSRVKSELQFYGSGARLLIRF